MVAPEETVVVPRETVVVFWPSRYVSARFVARVVISGSAENKLSGEDEAEELDYIVRRRLETG